MKRFVILTLVGVSLLGASPARSSERVFIHLSDNFKENDGPVCVAFNAAWQAMRSGDEVEIFFDQEATYGVKQWEPGRTDLGLYPLPDRLNELLSQAFEMDETALPANYQVFLKMLHENGVRVTANGFWNALTQVEETVKGRQNILPYVEPLTLAEFLEHRTSATVYLKF